MIIDTEALREYQTGCFNCGRGTQHPFDTIIERYEVYFDRKKKHLEERLAVFQEMKTVWETLELILKKSRSKLWVEH